MTQKTFQIAAVQASPVFMDREATVEKACRLIAEAANQWCAISCFPRNFYPCLSRLDMVCSGRSDHSKPETVWRIVRPSC